MEQILQIGLSAFLIASAVRTAHKCRSRVDFCHDLFILNLMVVMSALFGVFVIIENFIAGPLSSNFHLVLAGFSAIIILHWIYEYKKKGRKGGSDSGSGNK